MSPSIQLRLDHEKTEAPPAEDCVCAAGYWFHLVSDLFHPGLYRHCFFHLKWPHCQQAVYKSTSLLS